MGDRVARSSRSFAGSDSQFGKTYDTKVFLNPRARKGAPYDPTVAQILNRKSFSEAFSAISSWPNYAPTPLIELPKLASHLGVARIWCKYEASRLGLGSFKGLGVAYAVSRVILDKLKQRAPTSEFSSFKLMSGCYRQLVKDFTVCAPSSGNHGRGLAWSAQAIGCRSVVYLSENVSDRRAAAIAHLGAEVVRVSGNHDSAIERANCDAERMGFISVNELDYQKNPSIARDILQGYAVIAEEVLGSISPSDTPTHVFAPGGAGSLSGALSAHLWENRPQAHPSLVVVEPTEADSLFQSARFGRITPASGTLGTIMDGLAVREPSGLAWPILESGALAFVLISDCAAIDAMRLLNQGGESDTAIAVGETGVAGFAGFLSMANDERWRRELNLGPESRIVAVATEGPTDPELYRRLTGLSPTSAAPAEDRPS